MTNYKFDTEQVKSPYNEKKEKRRKVLQEVRRRRAQISRKKLQRV